MSDLPIRHRAGNNVKQGVRFGARGEFRAHETPRSAGSQFRFEVRPFVIKLSTSGHDRFDADDRGHRAAAAVWSEIVNDGSPLYTTNYVLLEVTSLLQRQLGIAAVDALTSHVLPWVDMFRVDETLQAQATTGLLAARRRDLSLVDHASFALMRHLGLRRVFSLDPHFAEQGFAVLP